MDQILRVFGVIAVMVLVIFAAYFVTKMMAVKAGGSSGKNRNFKLVDRFSISKDKMFILIAVGPSVYLIGVTNQGMTVIDQKDAADFPAEYGLTNKPAGGLQDILSGLWKSGPKNTEKPGGHGRKFSDFMHRAAQTGSARDEHKE